MSVAAAYLCTAVLLPFYRRETLSSGASIVARGDTTQSRCLQEATEGEWILQFPSEIKNKQKNKKTQQSIHRGLTLFLLFFYLLFTEVRERVWRRVFSVSGGVFLACRGGFIYSRLLTTDCRQPSFLIPCFGTSHTS